MVIHQVIGEIVASLSTETTFIKGWKHLQNVLADEVLTDIVFLDNLVSNDVIRFIHLEETFRIEMAFVGKSESDWTYDQHLVICDAQRTKRKEFMALFTQHAAIQEVSNVRTTDIVNLYDVNLSGVIVQFEAKLVNGYVTC